MARRWSSGDIELRYDADEGSFSAWYFEHRLPIAPERYGEMLRVVVKEAGAAETEAGKRLLALAASLHRVASPQPQGSARLQGELKGRSGAADIIVRGLAAYRSCARIGRHRRWRCIICWSASTTSSGTGGSPPATSTIAASSTSTGWRARASRTRARSGATPPAGKAAHCRRQAAGTSVSITSTACAIRCANIASACAD